VLRWSITRPGVQTTRLSVTQSFLFTMTANSRDSEGSSRAIGVKIAPKTPVPAVLLLSVVVLAGMSINSSHLKFQRGAIKTLHDESEQRRSAIRKPNVMLHNDTTLSPMASAHRPSTTGETGDDDDELYGTSGDDGDEMELSQETGSKGLFTDSCFKARHDTVHTSKYKTLQPPFINLGFPKMGTSSLHAFFKCGNLTSVHLNCMHGIGSCANCFSKNVAKGRPPLTHCGRADVYAQIDNGRSFPQIDLLEELVRGHPNATFFLTMRSMDKWFHSISHWPPRPNGPHMHTRFRKFNITGLLEVGRGRNVTDFANWYCWHVNRVRDVISKSPLSTLVEVDIEDPTTNVRMEDIFNIPRSCWGQANVNTLIHKDLNMSEITAAKMLTPSKKKLKNKRRKSDDNDDDASNKNDDTVSVRKRKKKKKNKK